METVIYAPGMEKKISGVEIVELAEGIKASATLRIEDTSTRWDNEKETAKKQTAEKLIEGIKLNNLENSTFKLPVVAKHGENEMYIKEVRNKYDFTLSPPQKEAIDLLTSGPDARPKLADEIGGKWQRGQDVPESLYRNQAISGSTVAAIERGNNQVVEKISGKEAQDRIDAKIKDLSEFISSPERKKMLLEIEKENVFPKPESLQDKNIVQVIEGRINDLRLNGGKVNGLEGVEFKVRKVDLCKVVASQDFQQQLGNAQRLVQSKSKGIER